MFNFLVSRPGGGRTLSKGALGFLASIGALVWSIPAWSQNAPDAAKDGVDFFAATCPSIVAGLRRDVSPDRYRIVRVSEKDAALAISGLGNAPLWSVNAPISGARMLHYVTPGGICAVEIALAAQADVEVRFSGLVQDLRSELAADEAAPDQSVEEDGTVLHIWHLKTSRGDLEIGLASFAPPRVEPQHILTMSRPSVTRPDPSTAETGR